MVDTRFIDLRSIPDDVRYKVFDYLWNVKRVGSRGLGISPALATWSRIGRGELRIAY